MPLFHLQSEMTLRIHRALRWVAGLPSSRDLTLFVLSTTFQKGLGVVAQLLLANLLGVIDYGAFALLFTGLVALEALATAGFGLAATRFVAEAAATTPRGIPKITRQCIRYVLVTSLAATAVLVLAFIFQGAQHAHGGLVQAASILMMSSAVPSSVSAVLHGALIGSSRYGGNAIALVFGGLILLVLPVTFASLFGAAGAMAGWGLGSWLSLAFLVRIASPVMAAEKASPGATSGEPLMRRRILRFALGAMLTGVVPLAMWIANWLLVLETGSTTELGKYQAIYQWFAVMAFVPTLLSQAMLAGVTVATMDSMRGGLNLVFKVSVWATIFQAVFCAAILALTPAIALIYRPEYHEAMSLLPYFAVAAIVVTPQTIAWNLFAAHERMYESFLINAFWAIVFIGSVVSLFAVSASAIALGIGLVIAYLVRGLLLAWWIKWRVMATS